MGFPFSSWGRFNIDITRSFISNIIPEILGAEKGTSQDTILYIPPDGGKVLTGKV